MADAVLLDTDIASDIDDLLALLMLVGSSEVEIVGIAAAYGDTTLRARIARQVCDDLGCGVPIAAGPTTTLSGAPIWYSGDEARQLDPTAAAASFEPDDAIELFLAASLDHRGSLIVAAIGPLTNLATAIRTDPTVGSRIGRLVVMGGDFGAAGTPEHNFRSDAVAARTVMAAGIPTTVVGVEQTRRIQLDRQSIDELCQSGTAPARFLREQATRWMARNELGHVLLHDPATVLTAIEPDEFTFTAGAVEVDAGTGATSFKPGDGNVELVTALRPDRVAAIVADRVAAAVTPAP